VNTTPGILLLIHLLAILSTARFSNHIRNVPCHHLVMTFLSFLLMWKEWPNDSVRFFDITSASS